MFNDPPNQQQGSWCSPANFTSHLFQQSSSGFHPGSFTSPSSFGTTSLARMETTFCKNFVCCSIPLDDLHDLLEHYEQAHCQQSSAQNPSHDSNSNNDRPDLVVFEDEDEWSGTESASTHLSARPGFDRGHSPADNWSFSSLSSREQSLQTRRKNRADHWSKVEDGFGIPPSLLDGQNQPGRPSSSDPNQFLTMIDGDEDGFSSIGSDRNVESQPVSDSVVKRGYTSEHRDWGSMREKPFKCSVPGCGKAYKQPNGLKYHQTHGHCSKRNLISDGESKAVVCHDPACGRRYKNINGLRHHYQQTGPHGRIGLQLLSLGLHPTSTALSMSNLTTNHQHRHPLLTSFGSSTSGSHDGGSVCGLPSEAGDVVMNDQ